MPIAFTLAGLAVVLVAGLLAVGWLGELTPAIPDRAPLLLPRGGELSGADIDEVRLAVGARGYRMDEVDVVLDRAAAGLAERDARIELLQRQLTDLGAAPSDQPLDAAAASAAIDSERAEPAS